LGKENTVAQVAPPSVVLMIVGGPSASNPPAPMQFEVEAHDTLLRLSKLFRLSAPCVVQLVSPAVAIATWSSPTAMHMDVEGHETPLNAEPIEVAWSQPGPIEHVPLTRSV
jgi:hypothetical protein